MLHPVCTFFINYFIIVFSKITSIADTVPASAFYFVKNDLLGYLYGKF
jgi:hypothetical protein